MQIAAARLVDFSAACHYRDIQQNISLETPMLRSGFLALALLFASMTAASAADLVLYGAGSLHGAMADVAKQFDQRFGTTTKVTFGPSGMMRERFEKGEHVDIFTSADMGNAKKLADAKRAETVVLFAR